MVREADPVVTARDAMRSLLFLEDRVAGGRPTPRADRGRPRRRRGHRGAAARPRTDAAFLEVAAARRRAGRACPADRAGLRPRRPAPQQARARGGAAATRTSCSNAAAPAEQAAALGVVAPPVAGVAARAKALLWPAVDRTRGARRGRAAGHHLALGAARLRQRRPGRRRRLAARLRARRRPSPDAPGVARAWTTSASPSPPEQLNEEVVVLPHGLRPAARARSRSSWSPHGRLRSRALRPPAGRPPGGAQRRGARTAHAPPATGVTQVAFACRDVAGQVRGRPPARASR